MEGKIIEHSFWLLKEGYKEPTIIMRTKLLKRLVKRGANLFDSESVKETIAKHPCTVNGKICYVTAYATFALWMNIPFRPPRYKRVEKLPWVPPEAEIDQLIAACSSKMATYLQLLKETGMRPGEAYYLKWTSIDMTHRSVRVTPEKNSKPRILSISTKLVEMLNRLPKASDRAFGNSLLRTHTGCFQKQRKRAAEKLKNPRLRRISFYSLRHWKATVEYHRTRDIFHVMRILGHRDIKNTLVYIDLEHEIFKTSNLDEFTVKVAHNIKEACRLAEAGFEKCDEFNDVHLYRKRK
jgi:integrase